MRIPVVYSQLMVAESGHRVSPSASKPAVVAQALRDQNYPVDFFEPEPATLDDFFRVHDPRFVNGVLEGRIDNGFGNCSMDVARTLPFTSGAMLTAAHLALNKHRRHPVVAALCSGFHHATWSEAAAFCTFNGLMVCAAHLLAEATVADADVAARSAAWRVPGPIHRVAIIDADYHFGDGTEDLLARTGLAANVFHFSFGREYTRPDQAAAYLARMRALQEDLQRFQPQILLYQAGADAHIEDPLGGLLTTEQMFERDETLFTIARDLSIPVVFNLAGGYQRDPDGGIQKVVRLHLGTFAAANRVFEVTG